MSEPPVDPELVDLGRLAEWMDGQGLTGETIADAELLAGGTQNILLRFTRGGREFVLRRPPPHLRKNSNETMRREARVLGAIAGTEVPHPRLIARCPETDVIGAAFYLMEPIDGFNPTQGLPEYHRSDPAIRRAMGFSLVDSVDASTTTLSGWRGSADPRAFSSGRSRAGVRSSRATPSSKATPAPRFPVSTTWRGGSRTIARPTPVRGSSTATTTSRT